METQEFFLDLHGDLPPRAHETLWKSLAAFRLFSWVRSVQTIITRWRRAEIQINWEKYQTNSEKSQTSWVLPNLHVKGSEKV